jgi:hypothetical protein
MMLPLTTLLRAPQIFPSPAGLTRGSISFAKTFCEGMDCRVKPGNDVDL